ncbi:MAG TPA: hypothetical protein VGV59_16465 [Pyrinomonadaceae bacterium]|nr:hypothetical protein [Pyrinomonadaceae bacterium]
MTKMNGLHVYFNSECPTTAGGRKVFYSRRNDGPYYCWRYQQELEKWLGSRVHLSELTRRSLSVASWASVPGALQATMDEHYLE